MVTMGMKFLGCPLIHSVENVSPTVVKEGNHKIQLPNAFLFYINIFVGVVF